MTPRPSNPRKPEKLLSLRPVPKDNSELAGQPVPVWTEPKGIDRYNVSSRVDPQHAVRMRNLMFEDGQLVSRLGTDLMGSNAASVVMQVVDLVRKGQKKVTVRFCLRHLEIFEYGLGAWRSFPIPLTGSERDFFAYTGWANKLLFSNAVDGLWEFDFTTMEPKLVPGAPGAKHLTTFGNRVVASSTVELAEDYPLRVRWSAKNLYNQWGDPAEDETVEPALAGGHEDLYGSPGGITDEAMGVFPFSDEQAWLIRSHSTWQMSVSGNALAPFRFSRVIPEVGTAYRNTIVSVDAGVIFASRDNVHYITGQGHSLVGNLVRDEIEEEAGNLRPAYATYDVGRQEYRLAVESLVWRYRFVEQGWTADEYPFPIRSLSRQVQGVAGIPIDSLPGTIDELSALFPPGAINDLVYDRSFDNAMMFVPTSTEITVRETDDPHDTLLTGEETDSEIVIESGVLNLDVLKASEIHGVHGEYESEMDQQLIFELSFNDGDAWQPYSLKDIEETFGSEMFFVKGERVSRKIRLRVRSTTLGKLRLLGVAPVLVSVERSMASRNPKPATIVILPSPLSLTVGGTQQLSWQVLGAGGQVITGVNVTFLSTNSAIATVSSTGLVRAIAPGSFAIVASVRNIQTKVQGTVSAASPAPVVSVTVTPSISQGAVGTTQQFTATLRDASGNVLLGRTVVWASSSPSFATVNSLGLVTLVTPGVTLISATAEGVTGASTLTVTPAAAVVDTVVVTPSPFSGEVGDVLQLTAEPRDSLGNVLSGKLITWGTSSAAVATVSATGVVTLQGVGSVTITATCETVPGTATGTVTAAIAAVSTVTVSPSSFSKAPGQTQQLTVTLKDSLGNVLTGRVITYQSSNTSIATVNSTGLVTAIAQGSTTITVTSEGKIGTATATVTAIPVNSVEVTPSSFSIIVGATQQLTATPRDSNGNVLSGRVVSWGSSDVTRATVSSSGLVTAIAAGSVTITATCETKQGTSSGTLGAAVYSSLNSPHMVDYVPEPNIPGTTVTFPQSRVVTARGTPSFVFTQTLNPSGSTATDAANLQTAINQSAARAGNTWIKLADGFLAVYSGSLVFPERSVAGKTYIEAVNLNSYASEGSLVNTSAMGAAPKIVTNTVEPAIKTAKRAKGYRLAGVEVYPLAQSVSVNYNYGLIRFGNADRSDPNAEFNTTDMSDDLVLDRCYIHGTAGTYIQHAVILNCKSAGVVNCWISGIKWAGVETHAISAWSAVGPHKIVGNYTEAASINILYGGQDPAVLNLIPADIEIRRNYYSKDLSWRGQGFNVKNLLEFKTGTRILVEGNVLRHSWSDGQEGFGINFQSLAGSLGDATKPKTSHVTCRYNWVDDINIGTLFSARGFDASGLPMSDIEFTNNLLTGVGGDTTNRGLQLLGALSNLRVIHNTIIRDLVPNGMTIIADPVDGNGAATNIVIRDNLLGGGQPYGTLSQSGGAVGTAAMTNFASSYSLDHNVAWDDPSNPALYPATNQFAADFASVQFNSPGTGDYSLAGGSPYKNDASDGTDPGANWTKLQLAISGVIPSDTTTDRVDVTPTDVLLRIGVTQQLTAVAYNSNNVALVGKTITWSSNNTGVATVDGGGLVTGVGSGFAVITATCEGKQDSTTFTVGYGIAVGTSWQSVVDAHGAGTIYIPRTGTHNNATVIPKSGDYIIGEPSVIMDGINVTQYAINGLSGGTWRTNVTVKNLEIKRYNPPAQDAAFRGGSSDPGSVNTSGWVVQNVLIHDGTNIGFRIGHTMQATNVEIHHHQLGIGGTGNSCRLNTINSHHCNADFAVDPGFEAGGSKFVKTNDMEIRNSKFDSNGGPGLWFDICNKDGHVYDTRAYNNGREGFVTEISYEITYDRCDAQGNGFGLVPGVGVQDPYRAIGYAWGAGFGVHASRGNRILNSISKGNFNGIACIQQPRGAAFGDPAETDGPYIISNFLAQFNNTQNIVFHADDGGWFSTAVQDNPSIPSPSIFDASRNNHWENNTYTLAGHPRPFTWNFGVRTKAEWQSFGHDDTGIFL